MLCLQDSATFDIKLFVSPVTIHAGPADGLRIRHLYPDKSRYPSGPPENISLFVLPLFLGSIHQSLLNLFNPRGNQTTLNVGPRALIDLP